MAGVRDCGWNPLQTVNYVSCHDNYSLYDQLLWCLSPDGGVTPPSPQTVAIASAACHAAVMSSNGVAFIQGGEELFRSKVITAEEAETNTASKQMYGQWITHNAYKSPLTTNAFDWSRKISITYKGVEYDVKGQSDAFASMINNRKNLLKVAYEDIEWPKLYLEGGKINFWNCIEKVFNDDKSFKEAKAVNGCSLIAYQCGDYFFFFAGRLGGSAPFGDYSKCSVIYSTSSDYEKSGSNIRVGAYNFVCMKRGA